MFEFFQKYFPGWQWAFAALFGAVVAVPFHDELKTRRGFVTFVFTGVACGYFLTGMAARYFNIGPESAGGVGFLLGAFGGSMISAIDRAFREADLWSLIKHRFGSSEQ